MKTINRKEQYKNDKQAPLILSDSVTRVLVPKLHNRTMKSNKELKRIKSDLLMNDTDQKISNITSCLEDNKMSNKKINGETVERNRKVSKKTQTLKAENGMREILKPFVTRGKRILTSIRKNKISLVQLYVEMSESALNEDEKTYNKFMREFRDQVNISPSAHSKLRTIVEHDGIVSNLDNLPGSWGSLYLLKVLTDEEIVNYINNKKIHKYSTFEQVRTQLKEDNKLVSNETQSGPIFPELSIFNINYVEKDFEDEQITAIERFERIVIEQESKLMGLGIVFSDPVTVNLDKFMEVQDEVA